jgi:hypothetical protein
LVCYAHRYLVVPGVRIEKTEGFAPSCRINYLIYARQRKQILRTCLVKAWVVNRHPTFLILLLYKYRVSKPLRVEYLSYEPCTKELHDLLANRLSLLIVEAAKTLFHWFRSWLDVQLVLGNLSRDPFMSKDFHANTLRFALRKSTSVPSYLGSSTVPIWSIRPSPETTASLTSLAGSKEQAARLDDSRTSWSSDRGSAWSLSDRMSASAN